MTIKCSGGGSPFISPTENLLSHTQLESLLTFSLICLIRKAAAVMTFSWSYYMTYGLKTRFLTGGPRSSPVLVFVYSHRTTLYSFTYIILYIPRILAENRSGIVKWSIIIRISHLKQFEKLTSSQLKIELSTALIHMSPAPALTSPGPRLPASTLEC